VPDDVVIVDRPTHGLARLYEPFRVLIHEIAKFGIIGMISFVIDVGLFNLMLFGSGPFNGKPLTAKVLSVAVATTFAYFGNRFWTFRHRGRTNMGREYVLFFLLNGVAMLIAVGCLAFSHYVLNLDSALADNISANVIGLVLGTLFRFWSYRKWVFPALPDDPADRELAERDAVTPI
jgi:putative flippase GtrA